LTIEKQGNKIIVTEDTLALSEVTTENREMLDLGKIFFKPSLIENNKNFSNRRTLTTFPIYAY